MEKKDILNRLEVLDGYLAKIKEYLPTDLEEYRAEEMRRRAIERLLLISIQSLFDISGMVVKHLELGIPSSDEDILDRLVKGRVIGRTLAQKLKEIRKIKDPLIYWHSEVNDAELFDFLTNNLSNLQEFSRQIKKSKIKS
jgi:uncharacterized protein YutE (UPF0331/DUF86 family)